MFDCFYKFYERSFTFLDSTELFLSLVSYFIPRRQPQFCQFSMTQLKRYIVIYLHNFV